MTDEINNEEADAIWDRCFGGRLREMEERPEQPAIKEDRSANSSQKPDWIYPGKRLENTFLKVVEHVARGMWLVECIGNGPRCRGVFEITRRELYNGAHSCGCVPKPRRPSTDLTDREFGRLKVVRFLNPGWECVCVGCEHAEHFYPKMGTSYAARIAAVGEQKCQNAKCEFGTKVKSVQRSK